MFILSYTTIYFFVNKYFFLSVFISVNAIFEGLYMFFGCERLHQFITYATGGELKEGGAIQNAYSCV